MMPNTQKFGVACAFALLLTSKIFSVDMVEPEIENLAKKSEETVTRARPCSKDGNFRTLVVCSSLTASAATFGSLTSGNTLIAGNLTVTGAINDTVTSNGTIDGNLTVESDLSVTGPTSLAGLLSLTTPNVLDYGYFSTASTGTTPQNAIYTAQVPTTAYTVVPGGITIANEGIYLIQYYATFPGMGPVTLSLELSGAIVAGTEIGANLPTSPLTGIALIIALDGQTLRLNSPDVMFLYVAGTNTAAFSIVRVR